MNLLLNKTAIITGASSGIGHASAKLFAREGAKLIVGARREDKLKELVREITAEGGQAIALPGDVTSEKYNRSLVELAISEFGKLNIAFNNAGTLGELSPVTEMTRKNWDNTLAGNLTSGFLAAKYQIPAMLQNNGGSIIFTSSVIGNTFSMPNKVAYAAGKAGLIGLVQTLAVEYGSQNIRINALLPGATKTPMAATLGTDQETIKFIESIHALKRRAEPEEIANSALYLASDLSSFNTGASMIIDGGVSICKM